MSEKYPHIKTDLRQTADTQEKTIAMFASDQQGDLVQLDQHMVPVFGPKGVLQDIGPSLASMKFDVTKLHDVQNITHWNGKRHGLLIQLNANTFLFPPIGCTGAQRRQNNIVSSSGKLWN